MIVDYLLFIVLLYVLMSFLELSEKRALNKSLVVNEFIVSSLALPLVFGRSLNKYYKKKRIVSVNNFILINIFLIICLYTLFYSFYGKDYGEVFNTVLPITLWLLVTYAFYLMMRTENLSRELYDSSQNLMTLFYIFTTNALAVYLTKEDTLMTAFLTIILLQSSLISSVKNYILRYRNESIIIYINLFILSLSFLSIKVFSGDKGATLEIPEIAQGLLIFFVITFVSIFRLQRENSELEVKIHHKILNKNLFFSNLLVLYRLVLW